VTRIAPLSSSFFPPCKRDRSSLDTIGKSELRPKHRVHAVVGGNVLVQELLDRVT